MLALFAVLLAAAYWNVVLAGKSLVYSDNYNPLDPALTEANYGPGFEPADTWHRHNWILYPNFHDVGAVWWQWEPGAEFLRGSFHRRELPLWDPYVAGGAPAMANLTHAFFFPPHLTIVALGNTSALRNAYYLALLLASGFFTYLLLRRHGLTPFGSLVGGIGFMFSGGLTQHAGSFVGQAAACLPATLYLTRWFIDRAGWSRAAALAIGYAIVSLTSFPPVLTQIFALSAAYAVCMIWCGQAGERRVRALGYYGLAAIASLLLVAFYYLPAFQAFGDSKQAHEVYRGAGLIGWAPSSLYQLLSPVLMGGADIFQAPLMPGMQYYYVPYVGIVLLWLSGLADSRGEGCRGPLFTFTLIAALVFVLKIIGVAPIHWLGYLPGLSTIHFSQYYGIGLNFLLAILAAVGAENLLARRISGLRILVLSSLLLVALCSLLQIAANRSVLELRVNRWLFEWLLLATLGLLAAGITIAARRRSQDRRFQWIVAGAALVLLYAEGARNAYYPRQVRANVFHRPPRYAQLLERRGPWSRVFTLGPLPANINSALEIPSWDSLMTFNSSRSFEIYRRYTGTRDVLFLRGALEIPSEPVLDAVGIDVIATRASDEAGIGAARARGYRELFGDDSVQLFERSGDPRCFFTSDFRVIKTEAALELLGRPRSARQILIEHAPAGLQATANRPDDPSAILVAAGRNRSRVKIDAPRPGFLYCSETYSAGWSAKVNGRDVPIVAANHAFRAVRLSPGPGEVELWYWPPGLTAGLWLSGLGALMILGAGIYGRR
ncbi:MAG TPA: YfhO family protein [Thermoanaerobaculia bacterium]|nr:YfhO family protein [Thermoanaerobaculia bacterium]